jgi:mono/diheme cytochrome c family protein
MRRAPAILALALALVAVTGCEDPVTDMGAQPKYQTYQPADTAQFANGASARPLPTGAVPTDASSPADDPLPLETPNPFPINRDTLEAGQLHFEIFCAVCHGRLGNGDGMVVQRGFTRPPSFHVDRLRAAPDAHVYNVITRGYGAMLSYNDRVPPAARWEIAAYIRALQTTSASPDLSDDARRVLVAQGDRPTTAPTRSPATRP